MPLLTRRNFIVTALAAGVTGGLASLMATGPARPGFVWRGSALGGEARIALYGADQDQAKAVLDEAAREIERLENIFSLYRDASELSRLNAVGRLAQPSRDLVEVLEASQRWRETTGGAFDPTVQPLWRALAEGQNPDGLISQTGAWIEIRSDQIALAQGSALTLNGIAQGRIADRVTEILVANGFKDVVIDAGELRLPGRERRAVGIPAAKAAVSVAEVAIATSEPGSLVFDQATWRHHLVDPTTGQSPRHWESISVFAPTAETADALSTAFAVMPLGAVADLVATIDDIAVIGRDGRGRIRRFGDPNLFGRRATS